MATEVGLSYRWHVGILTGEPAALAAGRAPGRIQIARAHCVNALDSIYHVKERVGYVACSRRRLYCHNVPVEMG
jgi:hypothetical protein